MPNKLAILDRDGVLNRERNDHTWLREDFELLENSLKAVECLHEQGWQLAIVTNQSGVGTGKFRHKHVREMFSIIAERWQMSGISGQFELYCAHHPKHGKCLCRKPGGLLLERAMAKFNSEPESCFFVGDRERDIEAAENVGIEGLLFPVNSDLYAFLVEKGKIIA